MTPAARSEAAKIISDIIATADDLRTRRKGDQQQGFNCLTLEGTGKSPHLTLDIIEERLIFQVSDGEKPDCLFEKRVHIRELKGALEFWWAMRASDHGKSASAATNFDRARKAGHDDLTGILFTKFVDELEIGGGVFRDIGTLILAIVPDTRKNPNYVPGHSM